MQNGNPYSPPLSDAVTGSEKLAKPFLWSWRQSIIVGILAGVAVTSGKMVFGQSLLPFLYYFGTYYFDCVLVALAFGLAYRWPKCRARTALGLSLGSFAVMRILDGLAFEASPPVPFLAWHVAIDALRSTVLIRCVFWSLELQPSRHSILQAVAAGVVVWWCLIPLGYYFADWNESTLSYIMSFNLDSSVVTALQLRYVLGLAVPEPIPSHGKVTEVSA